MSAFPQPRCLTELRPRHSLHQLSARRSPVLSRRPRQYHCQTINAGDLLNLHFDSTTVSIPFDINKAKDLKASVEKLLTTFAEKQTAERPKRWPAMEYRFKGESPSEPVEYLEIYCNPNAHSSLLDAKVLVTLRTAEGFKFLTEGRLTGLKSDLDSFLELMPSQVA
eukprot:jgi/Botrbrau1/13006/Bobra.0389s0005.1